MIRKCDKCGVENANTHVKTIINGELKEYDLCSACAHKLGYTNVFADMENDFSNLLGSFFGNVLPARTQSTRCEFCGSTYPEIANTGHVGCANCYQLFADRLNPSIVRIHGNAAHCGKHSKIALQKAQEAEQPQPETKEDKIKQLKSQLDEAIKQQEFEKAAELRDQIKEMEGQK